MGSGTTSGNAHRGVGGGAWGTITGTITNQEDLEAALAAAATGGTVTDGQLQLATGINQVDEAHDVSFDADNIDLFSATAINIQSTGATNNTVGGDNNYTVDGAFNFHTHGAMSFNADGPDFNIVNNGSDDANIISSNKIMLFPDTNVEVFGTLMQIWNPIAISENDSFGEVTLVAGTKTLTFTSGPVSGGYADRPQCCVHNHTNPLDTPTFVATGTELTITKGPLGSDTDVVGYLCFFKAA